MNELVPTEPITVSPDIDEKSVYLQSVLGAVPLGVVVVDQDLVIQAFNAAAGDIVGLQPEKAIGQSYPEVMKTQERDIADPLEEAMSRGESFVNQRFYLRDNTSDQGSPIRHSAALLVDDRGQAIGGVTIFADISRQVALEKRLQGQRDYLHDVLRAIPDGVATTDAELKIASWNAAAARITGRTEQEAIGQPCAEMLSPRVASVLQRALERGNGSATERLGHLKLEDGTRVPIGFSTNAVIVRDDHGEKRGIVVFRDIRERLARRREMAQQRHYLEQVLELAPYGIFTVDQNMVIQTFNQAAAVLTGYAVSFAIGKPYQEIVEFDPDSETDPLPEVLTSGAKEIGIRLTILDAGGKRIPVRYSAVTLTDADDQPIGAIVIFQDISDIVAAERTKNEFISMVSHELRTPLTSIRGFITAMLDGRAGEINDQQERFLSISREQSNRLLALINDLLDLTSLESGDIDLDQSHISVTNLVRRSAEAIEPLAEQKDLTLDMALASDVPNFWGDEQKISQVLQNLLANAVKFTPEGGQIVVRAELADPDTLALSVADTGIGIAPEEQERIFDPFYQVENVQTRSVGGTGLGLAIVKRIVEAHDGHMHLESQVGVGSTFSIHLPVVKRSIPIVRSRLPEYEDQGPSGPRQSEPAAQAAIEPAAKTERERPLILVVDDDPSASELIQFLLEQEGYDVIEATNGPDALEIAAERQPDLITLDILMPDLNGFSVLDKLNKSPNTANIPVCIVSIIEDKAAGYRLGAIAYVTKPFESEDLLDSVHNALSPTVHEGDSVRVLVIEDDPNIVELVELALDQNGHDYEVTIACNGVAGLEALHRIHPDLVLLDIMVPKINGYEFIRQAKANANTADIPIIVLSVRSLEEDVNRALQLGAEKYIIKADETARENIFESLEQVVEEILDDEQA